MTLTRLDSVAPSLASRLRIASAEQRRRAASAACEYAVRHLGPAGADAERAISLLQGNMPLDADLQHRLECAAAQLDAEYYRLRDEGQPSTTYLSMFSHARLMSALAFVALADDAVLHEAIYEAAMAFDSAADVLSLAAAQLTD